MVECIDYCREGNRVYDRDEGVTRFLDVCGSELSLPSPTLDTLLLVVILDAKDAPLSEITYPFVNGDVPVEKKQPFLEGLAQCIRIDVEKRTDVYNLHFQKYACNRGRAELKGILPVQTKDVLRCLDMFSR